MTRQDVVDAVIEAAMTRAAETGWESLSLGEIAAAAGLPLSQVYPVLSSKAAILEALAHKVDRAVLAGAEAEAEAGFEDEPARDRLFDVLMRRFDALQPYKPGIAAVVEALPSEPVTAVAAAPGLLRSMSWMLDAAGIQSEGAVGAGRAMALAGIWLLAVRAWLADDSPDMSRTMAELDARLHTAEGWELSLSEAAQPLRCFSRTRGSSERDSLATQKEGVDEDR